MGAGEQDVDQTMSILGVRGGISFDRSYHRHAPNIGESIIEVCDQIIIDARNKEILATVKETLGDGFNSTKEQQMVNESKTNKPIQHIESSPVGLVVSYDMS